MNAISPRVFSKGKLPLASNRVVYALWLLWQVIRLPVFLLLSILEPVVSFVLGSLALLGVLMAFFWWFVGRAHFPFLLVLGVSLGFQLALILYRELPGLLRC